jgi:hypothetical protein
MFSAYVYPDGLVETVKEQDTAYENRGDSGLVYDETFARHWDKWVGSKRKALIGVSLAKVDAKWVLGQTYVNVLKGTGLVSTCFYSLAGGDIVKLIELVFPCGTVR